MAETGEFSVIVPLAVGVNTITLTAADAHGNEGECKLWVVRKSKAPSPEPHTVSPEELISKWIGANWGYMAVGAGILIAGVAIFLYLRFRDKLVIPRRRKPTKPTKWWEDALLTKASGSEQVRKKDG
jgi:hypothetical protein